MFKRYPYRGWLGLTILLWALVSIRSYQHTILTKPASMARTIEKDLASREEKLDKLLENKDLLQRMFTGNLKAEEVDRLSKQPFYLFGFHKDTLIFWNSSIVIGTCANNEAADDHYTLDSSNGIYLKQCLRLPYLDDDRTIVALFPVSYNYPFENEYLHSHFAAAEYIPVSTRIHSIKTKNSYDVKDEHGHSLFSLQFNTKDIPKWVPDPLMVGGILIALFLTITWINLIAVAVARKKSPFMGLLVILVALLLFRAGTYAGGYPFSLGETSLFSPQLYATSVFLPSLGDLILNVLCTLWVLIFLLSYFRDHKVVKRRENTVRDMATGVLMILLMTLFAFWPADIMRRLVIDSRIPFDVSHFYSINIYTIVGLATVALIACCMCLVIYLLNIQASTLFKHKGIQYGILITVCALILFFKQGNGYSYQYYVFGLLLIFVLLLEVPVLRRSKGLFAPNMIFWAVFIAACCATALHYFNDAKEEDSRKLFAERVVDQRDQIMEYLFTDIAEKIGKDSVLRGFLKYPSSDIRPVVDEHLGTAYLRGQLNRYQPGIYLFDKSGQPLYNKDTLGLDQLFEIITNAEPASDYLFYRENARDGHYYIGATEIRNDSGDIKGYAFIDLSLKKAANESVYPELLQPAKVRDLQSPVEYGYGIYVNRHLITQTNDFPFPVYLRTDTLKPGSHSSRKADDAIIYLYKIDAEKTVVIRHIHSITLEGITLFSYLLGVLMILSLIALFFHLYFLYLLRKDPSEKLIHLTLRKRIHFAMLGVVLVSFTIIGTVTIMYFIDQYDKSSRDKLQAVMQTIERSVLQYLGGDTKRLDPGSFDYISSGPAFRSFISNLAKSQSTDLNVYNSYGSLNATSQEDIYNKVLLARIMMPDAYYKLSEQNKPLLIQNEYIGKLDYISCYVPLRGDDGYPVGYINVPFFASQKELNYQISNILIALINLYAFIFLISSILAVLITNWLTRTLQVIINRFEKVNLKENEILDWPYDDEIGVLVREYNKMVKKVEENATLMAKNERESAWREMARQVAHEIKNPLTPMKLNIQYLQQALKSEHPNIRQLTEHVSESLIEQIDNLSHIATAFSSFATMPEARPEHVDLNELLNKATELYRNSEQVNVSLSNWKEPLIVHMDKSQLLRVFTNLMQNAVEAIPEEKQGSILVALTKEDGYALIRFADNGNGIPEDIAGKIFNPYFTTKGSGTGLGLAMTKKIIEFWNGTIRFETKDGEGTTFYVHLPLEMEASANNL